MLKVSDLQCLQYAMQLINEQRSRYIPAISAACHFEFDHNTM